MLKAFFTKISKVHEMIARTSGTLSGVCVLVMVLTIVVDITGRTFFYKPLEGTLELNEMLMVLIVFLGLAWTQSQRGNVKIEVFTSRLSHRSSRVVDLAVWTMSLVFASLITIGGTVEALHSTRIREAVWGIARFPVWPGKIILSFGCFLLCIQFLVDILHEVGHLLSHKEKT
jgi:TRAP-type mannitol/chloroaromatic compound transport system permease small subunit